MEKCYGAQPEGFGRMQFYSQQLDYNIKDVHERMALVSSLLEGDTDLPLFVYGGNARAQNVVEKLANYVLFAYKDDKEVAKEFKIETKHSSYSRRKEESLDELLESPTFDEHRVAPVARSIYTRPKESISDADLADIPELLEMREEIELFELILEFNKERDDYKLPDGVPRLTEYQMYKWKHMCIDMRRSQYALRDSCKPRTTNKAHLMPRSHLYLPYSTVATQDLTTRDNGEPVVNFGNKLHVYILLSNYSNIVQDSYDKLNSDIKYIMWELDEYIEKANLSEDRMDILIAKIDHRDNERIAQDLQEKYGLAYNANYISTIWKHEICDKIAKIAVLSAQEWGARNCNSAWKTCSSCGQRKLKDHANFGKKSSANDGYNGICKQCLREKRKKVS